MRRYPTETNQRHALRKGCHAKWQLDEKRTGRGNVQTRTSATRSRTCSAIDGAEVSPGDSIPIRWMTAGNCGSRWMMKSATPVPLVPAGRESGGGINFARIPEYAWTRSVG